MHGDWSSAESPAGDVGRVCAFGGVASAAARVVSSALVSCEIPPRPGLGGGVGGGNGNGNGYVTGDVAAPVSVLSRGADDFFPGSEGLEGYETNDGTGSSSSSLGSSSSVGSYPSNHSLAATGSLWVEYLADGAGVADGFPIDPPRGPLGRRLRGDHAAVARQRRVDVRRRHRGAGCRFGSVQVSARWAGGADVECVSPGRGLVTAAVEASAVADWTTHSFPPPKQEMGRVFYRYVRF